MLARGPQDRGFSVFIRGPKQFSAGNKRSSCRKLPIQCGRGQGGEEGRRDRGPARPWGGGSTRGEQRLKRDEELEVLLNTPERSIS